MARGLLADADCEGQFQILLGLLRHDTRRELWESLALIVVTFSDLALQSDATDQAVWNACQQHELVLITANRNAEHAESLQATIETFGTPDSLPVLTLADPQRILRDRDYAERVADRLLEYPFDYDRFLGTGRLFLP